MAKSRKHEHPEDMLTRITRKTEQFIVKYLKTILLSVGAAVIIVAAYFIVQYGLAIKEKSAESLFSKVYLVYSSIESDFSLGEEELKDKLISLNEDFKIVMEQYPKSAASSRSAYYIGNILFRYGEFEEALTYYGKGALIKPNNYSALLCIQGEASCYEQLGEYEKAEERYKRIISKHSDSFLVPMVRFSLAQIYEKQEKYEEARKQYNQIVSDYGWSSWAGLAEKKILVLKSS